LRGLLPLWLTGYVSLRRLLGRASSYDILINLIGMVALVVGAVLIP
jgi:hypothetical protein